MSSSLLYICASVRVCMCSSVRECTRWLVSLLLRSPEWARRPDTDGIPAGSVLGPLWKSQRHSDRRSICLCHQTHPQFFHPGSADWYQNKKMDRTWVRTRGMFYGKWKRAQGEADCQGTWSFLSSGGCLCTDLGFTSLRAHMISIFRCFLREKHFQSGRAVQRWSLFIQATL